MNRQQLQKLADRVCEIAAVYDADWERVQIDFRGSQVCIPADLLERLLDQLEG